MQKPSIKKITLIVIATLAAGFQFLLLILVLLLGIAQTETGRKWVVQQAASALSREPDQMVRIGKMEGNIPVRFKIDQLTVSDAGGPWLLLDDIHVRWTPTALLRGDIHVNELCVATVTLNRVPPSGDRQTTLPFAFPSELRLLEKLVLDRLAIEDGVLEPAVLGQKARFKIDAACKAPSVDGTRTAVVRIDQTQSPKGRCEVTITVRESPPTIQVAANVQEEKGGGLSGALGAPGPLTFTLDGEGTKASWQGRLKAVVDGLGSFDSSLEAIAADEEIMLHTAGVLNAAKGALPDSALAVLGRDVKIEMTGRFSLERAVVERLAVSPSDRIGLEVAGSLDLASQETKGTATFACDDPGAIRTLTNIPFSGRIVVRGNFSGPLLQPQADLTLSMTNAAAKHWQADSLASRWRISLLAPLQGTFAGVGVKAEGTLEGLAFNGAPLLGQGPVAWTLEGKGPLGDTVYVSHMLIAHGNASLNLTGQMDIPDLEGQATVTVDVPDIRPLVTSSKQTIAAGANLHVLIEGNGRTRSASASLQGAMQLLDQVPASISHLLGKEVAFGGKIAITNGKELKATDLRMDTRRASLIGNGAFDLLEDTMEGSWHLLLPRLEAFSPTLGRNLGGAIQIKGEVQVKENIARFRDAADWTAHLTGEHITIDGLGFQNLDATIQGKGLIPKSRGSIETSLVFREQHLSGATAYILEGPSLTLSDLSLNAEAGKVQGDLAINLGQKLVAGRLQAKGDELTHLSPLAQQKIGGRGELTSLFTVVDGNQHIELQGSGENLQSPFGNAARVVLVAKAIGPFDHVRGAMQLSLHDFRLDHLALKTLDLEIDAADQAVTFTGTTTGRYKGEFDLTASGTYEATPDSRLLTISSLGGRYEKMPLKLRRPASVSATPDGYTLDTGDLEIGNGRLQGSAGFQKNDLTVRADLEEIPLAVIRFADDIFLDGKLSGNMTLRGGRSEPDGALNLVVHDLKIHQPQMEGFPPADLSVQATWHQSAFHAACLVKGLAEKPLNAELTLPVVLSTSPFALTVPRDVGLQGRLTGAVELARFPYRLLLGESTIEGTVEMTLGLQGTVDAPKLTGTGRLLKGTYENTANAIVFKEVDLVVRPGFPRMHIDRGRATDGGTGTISMEGWIDLLPSKDFPFHVQITLDQTTLLRHDNATATADGQITLSGSFLQSLIAADLKITRGDLRIPDKLPSELTHLEVIEINRPGEAPGQEPSAVSVEKGNVHLQMHITAPGRIFLRGRGLDSEWAGDVNVRGTLQEPILTGQLSVVRGRFDFLGKRFTLVRGFLVLDGAVPPAPRIDLVAEAPGKDMVARINLTGSAASPKLTLSSEPPFPSDEILTRLLFGRSVADITPMQAVQLAAAATTLAGGDSSFDIMDRARKFLFVDQLEVKQAEGIDKQTTVSAGKYLREGVYLEVEKGVGPESGKSSVQVDIPPNLTLETEVGENAQGGVGLNWRLNY